MKKVRVGVLGAGRGMTMINQLISSSDAELVDDEQCKLLVSWHIQEIAKYNEEEEDVFDPMDESDERFQDILYPADPGEDA